MSKLVPIDTRQPFSFQQTLTFVRRFPAAVANTIVTDDSVTAAVSVGGRAHAFTLRERSKALVVELADDAPAELAMRAADFVGAGDDLSPLYARAKGDAPFAALVKQLHGLHQVRFLGLEEIAVYCVMMQRTPPPRAVALEQKFLARFGRPVKVGGRELRAFPSLDELAALDGADIARAIGNRPKSERIAAVVRGVAALGEPFLREAPYAQARDALLAIDGVGPFSAAAILLRGLGRVDELPSLDMFERDGRVVYGARWDADAIARRYGDQIGYWSFYVKTGAARRNGATS